MTAPNPLGPTMFERIFEMLTPASILDDPRADGHGVRVCVVDSGVESAELAQRYAKLGREIVPIRGAVFQPGSPEPAPYDGHQSAPHGTTVADIILRLAPKVELFSADVFGPRGSCEVEAVIRAIRHAIDVWDCRIINLSLGVVEQRLMQLPKRQQLLRAVEDAYFRDVLLIAAAHNEHPFTRSYPAMFAPPLVSVDKGLFADPLQFAYRLVDQIEFQAHGRGYVGPFAREPATSWAAPHLTGIAARILSLQPGLKPFEVKTILYWLGRSPGERAAP